jgi:hypothetical protein
MAKKSARKFRFSKNMLPIAAVVVVGAASIAYAAYTTTLNIAGTGTVAGSWDVRITDIVPDTDTPAVGESDVATYPKVVDATHAAFSSNLAYPGAFAIYDVTVQNFGQVPAYLDNMTSTTTINAAAPAGVHYTIDPAMAANSSTPSSATQLDAAGGSNDAKTFTVKVEWLSSDTTANYTTGQNKTFNLALGWNQFDG